MAKICSCCKAPISSRLGFIVHERETPGGVKFGVRLKGWECESCGTQLVPNESRSALVGPVVWVKAPRAEAQEA